MWTRHGAFVDPNTGAAETQFGVDIDWGAGISPTIHPFLAMGGAVYAKAAQVTLGSGTSTVISGLGFQPNLVILASNEHASPFNSSPGFIDAPVYNSQGICDGALNQFAIGNYGGYLSPGTPRKKRMTSGAALLLFTGTSVRTYAVASLDADGFTLSHAAGTGIPIIYLAIQLDRAPLVGITTQGTTKLNTSFRAGGLLTLSAAATALDTTQGDLSWSGGVASDSPYGDAGAWSSCFVIPDGGGGSDKRMLIDNSSVLTIIDDDGGWGIKAQADVSSWDTDGVSLSWPVNDAGGRYFGYVVLPHTQNDPGTDPIAHVSLTPAAGVGIGDIAAVVNKEGACNMGLTSSDGTITSYSMGIIFYDGGGPSAISNNFAGQSTYWTGAESWYTITSSGTYVAVNRGALPILGVG